MNPKFQHLNLGWNADPNAPEPRISVEGTDLLLRFNLNYFLYEDFEKGEQGTLRFVNCSRYLLGGTNDEGWYLGQCRFSKLAPAWGEFYRISGESESSQEPTDLIALGGDPAIQRHHFLFYLRDETFECWAENCSIPPSENNSLHRAHKRVPSLEPTTQN